MIRRKPVSIVSAVFALAVLLTMPSGCSRKNIAEPAKPILNTVPVSAPAPTEAPAAESGRQNGERFEGTIILEGMEETVRYEHVKNGLIGFEMDYDYENFNRRSESDRECFVSVWDNPGNPENYLEVRFSPLNADAAAASVSEALSVDYDISRDDSFMLDRAGSCIRIDASAEKGGLRMPDHLQMVYIVPAADGCRVATAHYSIESAEGFGRRFRYFMDTFSAIAGQEAPSVSGTWQTASMGIAEDGTMFPEYYVRFTDSEILYGHLKNGQFVLDHSNKIVSLEKTAAGGYRIQAESSNGGQYTYQTCESDDAVLEYYETWREEDFPEMYRGGASLHRD